MLNGVVVVMAHAVGSNNGFEPRDMATVREHLDRDAANGRWLRAGFAAARDADAGALILAIHGNMFGPGFGPPWDPEGFLSQSGFARFAEGLIDEANAFAPGPRDLRRHAPLRDAAAFPRNRARHHGARDIRSAAHARGASSGDVAGGLSVHGAAAAQPRPTALAASLNRSVT